MARMQITAEPAVPQLVVTSEFAAPRDLLFRAYTDPELLVQWLEPHGLALTIDHLDLRHGGTWRYIGSDTDGGKYSFRGVFHGTPSPDGIVQTSESDSMPGHVCLVSIIFTEREGTTTVTQTPPSTNRRKTGTGCCATTWAKTSTRRWSASSSCWHS